MAKPLRAWRTERLLSTRRLAELAGSSNKTIVQLENGRQIATFATIGKLSRVLEVEPRDVLEFARAIDVRAGVTSDTGPEPSSPRRKPHVYCVSSGAALLPLASHLLATGQYAVTVVAGVALDSSQISAAQPDIMLLDLDDSATRALLHNMLDDRGTPPVPVIVTGSDRDALDRVAATPQLSGAPSLAFLPLERDPQALVSAVESCLAGPAQ